MGDRLITTAPSMALGVVVLAGFLRLIRRPSLANRIVALDAMDVAALLGFTGARSSSHSPERL